MSTPVEALLGLASTLALTNPLPLPLACESRRSPLAATLLFSIPHFPISAFPHFPFLISPFLVLVQPPDVILARERITSGHETRASHARSHAFSSRLHVDGVLPLMKQSSYVEYLVMNHHLGTQRTTRIDRQHRESVRTLMVSEI